MAVDAQKGDLPRRYTEAAGVTFPTAVDHGNVLSRAFGFKVVPNGVFVDEAGVIRYMKLGGFDLRLPEPRRIVERFLRDEGLSDLERMAEAGNGFARPEAYDLFVQGLALYQQGRVQETLEVWRRAVALEPDNNVIRKQVWALEHPEKFYVGAIDMDWQAEQRRLGR